MSKFKNYIFDLDGTIINSSNEVMKCFKLAFEETQIAYDESRQRRFPSKWRRKGKFEGSRPHFQILPSRSSAQRQNFIEQLIFFLKIRSHHGCVPAL